MPRFFSTLLLSALLLWTDSASAQKAAPYTLQNTTQYQQCTALTHTNPQAALTFADNWLRTSQEMGASHCRALALYGMGRFSESADLMDVMADKVTPSQPTLWTSLLHQSGKSHELAGRPEKALSQWSKAIDQASLNNLDQVTVGLLTSHAELLTKQGKYFDAIQDLDHAIALSQDPALTLARAKLFKQMGAPVFARRDVNETLKADPENAEAKALSATLPGAPKAQAKAKARPKTVTAKRVSVQKKLAKAAKKKAPVKKAAAKKSTAKKKKKK